MVKPHPGHAIVVAFMQSFVLLMGTPFQQFLLLKVCSKFDASLELDYETCAKRSDVQVETASWVLWLTMSQSVPAFFVLIFAGYFVDTFGHKTALKAGLIQYLVLSFAYLLAAISNLSFYALVIVGFICGISGGTSLFSMAESAYIAATTTPINRTKYFMFELCALSISSAISPLFAGYITKIFGFPTLFSIMFSSAVALAIYIFFIFPDTRNGLSGGNINSSSNTNSSSKLLKIFQESITTTSATISFLFSHTASASIMLILMVFGVVLSASGPLFTMYPTKAFAWDAFDIGQFQSFKSTQRILLLTVGHPMLERISQYNGDKMSGEIRLLRFSLFAATVSSIFFGISRDTTQFYVSTVFASLGTFAYPTSKSLLSILTPAEMQGRVFGSLELFLSATQLAGSVLCNKVYQGTVSWMPQALFFLIAGLDFCSCLTAFLGLKKSGIDSIRAESASFEEVVDVSNEETPLLV
ncbi:hypothetical protein HK100_004588 [Physocladia obscura]|uniref:Major facilitator superfamily (MFS) profile domain-containing protein n=1 Tax=Physocladia obscura TaxID=109957 RepID=A0AAD5T6Z9_9FUNG|nr:hypothetical protein HK100_004588 [Physocladia obscura]